jgi:hypothetical protein
LELRVAGELRDALDDIALAPQQLFLQALELGVRLLVAGPDFDFDGWTDGLATQRLGPNDGAAFTHRLNCDAVAIGVHTDDGFVLGHENQQIARARRLGLERHRVDLGAQFSIERVQAHRLDGLALVDRCDGDAACRQ